MINYKSSTWCTASGWWLLLCFIYCHVIFYSKTVPRFVPPLTKNIVLTSTLLDGALPPVFWFSKDGLKYAFNIFKGNMYFFHFLLAVNICYGFKKYCSVFFINCTLKNAFLSCSINVLMEGSIVLLCYSHILFWFYIA